MPTNQFTHTSSVWVRYTDYEWRTAPDGKLYLTPAPDAAPVIYDPLQEAQSLVLDALHIGRMGMSRKTHDADIQAAILSFARKYGLFGLMTALPTTPDFMEYEAVYLPKKRFIRQETMPPSTTCGCSFPSAVQKLPEELRSQQAACEVLLRKVQEGIRGPTEKQR